MCRNPRLKSLRRKLRKNSLLRKLRQHRQTSLLWKLRQKLRWNSLLQNCRQKRRQLWVPQTVSCRISLQKATRHLQILEQHNTPFRKRLRRQVQRLKGMKRVIQRANLKLRILLLSSRLTEPLKQRTVPQVRK